MFLLDTNILSAAMSARPAPQVADWMAEQPPDLLFTATVCQAEILSGIAVLPHRRRAGRPAAMADLMIASIARTRAAAIVTRDTDGFEGCGLNVINHWVSA